MAKQLKNNVLVKQFDAGVVEGRKQMVKEVLDLLEQKYMDSSIDRGSPRAEAILIVAREVAGFIRDQK